MANQLDYAIPLDQGFSELLSSLQQNFQIRIQAETISHRVFFDTFDWLLYKNGSVLEMHEDEQSRKIYWREQKEGELKIQLGLNKMPHLATDLPAGEFRQQLQSVISVRELLPRIRIKIKRLPLVLLDKNEKVVVRINLDEHWYYRSKTRAGTVLGKRITVKPVKGYPAPYAKLEALLQSLQLRPAQDNILKLALAECGKSTDEYTSKLNLLLDPDMAAEEALKHILLRLLEILQLNTAGSIRGRDTEFMHDYRVAIRKTRSALTQITHVLPQTVTTQHNKFFSRLGKLTNPVRDLDVFLLELEGYQRDLKKSRQKHLRPLRAYLLNSRDEAQKRFVATLKSSEYRTTIDEWRGFLQQSDALEPPQKHSRTAVYRLADELIWNIYQLALEEGNAITDDSEAEALHELRKTCKKLRYLMDFFQSLYPAQTISELLKAMKGLQDNLGTFNDLYVHIGILKEFISHSSEKDAKKACNQLIVKLERRKNKTRHSFAQRYADFSTLENQNEFKGLFVNAHQ